MKKNYLFYFYIVAFILFLVACQSSSLTEKARDQEIPISHGGITAETEKEQYSTSAERITLLIHNESEEDLTSGIRLHIQKKVDDIWYEVPYREGPVTEQGIIHSAGQTSALSCPTSELKHDLAPGEYRAVFGPVAAPFEVVKKN
ncbi:immunoglobulin-like domain-containing protein [Planococcus salinus]|uniref:Bacterial Ig-like domain-containing protein n=1 Tax=Planococcus salinus TaxID=1848460 RepID=A0A3M8PC67_9BACL|nr:immunoglobulin-like domain-containing protein [Planococcus salinus]RNF41223.1 hypothetical protein EEX84_02430 [Planococcus salinus]